MHYRAIYSDRLDAAEIGQTMLDMFLDGMRRSMAVDRLQSPQNFIDVHYAKLVADPIAVARRIYEQFGYRYDVEFERKMREFIANDRSTPVRPHSYGLEQFGLSQRGVVDRSGEYLGWVERRGDELLEV